jgi:poly(A) polymerase
MSTREEHIARAIARRLHEHGHRALFAGGYVRDRLLGTEEPGDIDIATDATPDEIASIFPRVAGVGAHFGVMLVIEEGIAFEVATFRSDIGGQDGRHPDQVVFTDPRTDAMRRDFTINGLFYDPLTDEVLDYVGGRADLEEGIIRAIGTPSERFAEDYLRVLRAIRFAARLAFRIEPQTHAALRQAAEGIRSISQERIFQELTKMLTGPHPARAVGMLHEAGVLGIVLPEVDRLAGLEQPPEFHPEGDVLTHTIKALALLERRTPVTAWATLLHDVGKAETMTVTDRIRFNNHHRVGARIAAGILRRLHSSRTLIESVCACVDNHMNFMNVTGMRLATLKRLLARPTIEEEMELHRVDCLSSHGDLSNYHFLREKQRELAVERLKPEPLLRGRDLLAMGLAPGPRFGRILAALYDLQLDERIGSREEALRWVREHREEFM